MWLTDGTYIICFARLLIGMDHDFFLMGGTLLGNFQFSPKENNNNNNNCLSLRP